MHLPTTPPCTGTHAPCTRIRTPLIRRYASSDPKQHCRQTQRVNSRTHLQLAISISLLHVVTLRLHAKHDLSCLTEATRGDAKARWRRLPSSFGISWQPPRASCSECHALELRSWMNEGPRKSGVCKKAGWGLERKKDANDEALSHQCINERLSNPKRLT